MAKIRVSKDPNKNWNNDAIQFPRLISELEACGVFADKNYMKDLRDSMDLSGEEIGKIIDRAQKVWEDVKSRTKR